MRRVSAVLRDWLASLEPDRSPDNVIGIDRFRQRVKNDRISSIGTVGDQLGLEERAA
jgi:hypothetical protein